MNCFNNDIMILPLLVLLLCSLCFCSVNSQDATHNVTGPDYLVTDGTRNITLTCQSETPLADRYVWFTPGIETKRCRTGPSENVCTFTPRLEDDNSNVTCLLLDSQGAITSRALYMVNLKYPPQSSPNITIEPSQTEPLKQGDIITCTVTGGKPRVSAVIIYCQYPDHEDQEDDVSDDGKIVTSSIMVNTSQSTEVSTTCTCYANWPPEPGLYTDRSVMSLQLEYKAKLTNFTINGTTELTVNETSHSTVTFACQGDGRPAPVLRLYKQGDDTALIQAEINADTQELVYTIDNVRGEDLATYTCEADNGFQDLSTSTVQLWVNSAPRILDNSSNFASPPTLPSTGLTFSLVAYPTPQFNDSYFLGTVTKPEPAPENTFKIQCTRNISVEHIVTCHVTPQNVPKENVGLYEMSVTNELGDASFRFRVGTPVSLPQDDDSTPTVAIVGAVVGVLLVIGIIVVIVICLRRRKLRAGHKGHHDSQNRNKNNGTTVPVTMTAATAAPVSLPVSNATDPKDKINDDPIAKGGYITVVDVGKKGQRYTDSKEYANVGELAKNSNTQGSNNAASTLRNYVQTPSYEDLTPGPIDAPKVMTTAETPDIVASIPEDSAEETNRPESEAYAVVAPKPKGDNQPIA